MSRWRFQRGEVPVGCLVGLVVLLIAALIAINLGGINLVASLYLLIVPAVTATAAIVLLPFQLVTGSLRPPPVPVKAFLQFAGLIGISTATAFVVAAAAVVVPASGHVCWQGESP